MTNTQQPRLSKNGYLNDVYKSGFWMDFILEEYIYNHEEDTSFDNRNSETFGSFDIEAQTYLLQE